MSSKAPVIYSDKTKLLLTAAKDNDLNTVTALLSQNTDANAQDAYGCTPLMMASDRGHLDIVEELVDHGAKLNMTDNYGQTALMYAAFSAHWEVLKYLIEHKAKVNTQTQHGQTALMKAAYSNALPIVATLIQNKASVDVQSREGRTAAMIAAHNNHLNVLVFLAETAKSDINLQDANGQTAIMLAAANDHMMVIEYLAQIGADLTIKDKFDQTVYEVPAANGNTRQAEHKVRVESAIRQGLQHRSETKPVALFPASISRPALVDDSKDTAPTTVVAAEEDANLSFPKATSKPVVRASEKADSKKDLSHHEAKIWK